MEGKSSSLILRVMRLTTPLPSARPGLGAASAEFLNPTEKHADALLRNAPPWEGEGTACGAGSTTVLPPSFGSIYASETFRCLLAIYNNSSKNVKQITVQVEVDNEISSLNRLIIDNRNSPREVLVPRECYTNVISTHLTEPGMHILKCKATFIDESQQLRTFRQFYRFNVLSPFEPGISVIPMSLKEESHEIIQYLVELRLLNATPAPIYIDTAKLHANNEYTVTPMISKASAPGGISRDKSNSMCSLSDIEGDLPDYRHASVSAGDTQSFIFYVVRHRDEIDEENNKMKSQQGKSLISGNSRINENSGSTRKRREIGNFSVEWRSSLGEIGVMKNACVAYEPRRKRSDVELSIISVPRVIRSQCPFIATCCVRNNTSNSVRLYLQVRRDLVGDIVPMGVSGMALNELSPGNSLHCTLTLLPLRAGQHAISGVRVFDMTSKKSYNADPPLITVL